MPNWRMRQPVWVGFDISATSVPKLFPHTVELLKASLKRLKISQKRLFIYGGALVFYRFQATALSKAQKDRLGDIKLVRLAIAAILTECVFTSWSTCQIGRIARLFHSYSAKLKSIRAHEVKLYTDWFLLFTLHNVYFSGELLKIFIHHSISCRPEIP